MQTLIDPLNERMASTKALLEQLDDLSDRLRDQGEKQAELLKRRNDLLGKVHENGDRNDLIHNYQEASRDFQGMTAKLSKEINDIQRQIDQVLLKIAEG